jgi:hypothetical protein
MLRRAVVARSAERRCEPVRSADDTTVLVWVNALKGRGSLREAWSAITW